MPRRVSVLFNSSKRYIKTANLFQPVPPSTDEHDLQNERISTRLYIFVLLISLLILLLYTSLITFIKSDTLKTPTYDQYQKLDLSYSSTLTCPCKHILIDYDSILQINYTFHQVCHSFFVSQDWIRYLVDSREINNQYEMDFRMTGHFAFRALIAFCQLVNRTMNESLNQFKLNQYVSATVTPLKVFESQVETFAHQFRSVTTSNFLRSLDIIKSTTQSNSLFSALMTNYHLEPPPGSILVIPYSKSYHNCSCATSSTCIFEDSVFNITIHGATRWTIPGLYRGCFVVEALLQSSLKCFFNSTCINRLRSNLKSSLLNNITALDSSLPSKYSVNSTIQELLNQLMIEKWNISSKYKRYYNACQPMECSYIHETRNGVIYIITALFGLVGGLTTFLKVVVPIAVKFIRRKKQLRTSATIRININERIRLLWPKIVHFIKNLNLFSSTPPAVDERDLRHQRISTRLYIFVLLISLLILLLYTSLITFIKSDTLKTPTYEQYQQLDLSYSSTLTCPCKHILIDYDSILQINYTFHQVCHSFFVSQDWIRYLANSYGSSTGNQFDFRMTGKFSFQALIAFCQLVNRTMNESLNQFKLNQYVSATVTPLKVFESQVETFVHQFKSVATNDFLRSLDVIRSTTQTNGLFSARTTNYYIFSIYVDNSRMIVLVSEKYSNCSCDVSATCISEYPVYSNINGRPMWMIPGFYRGCYFVEALLQSSLECFYNQACINRLQSYLSPSSPKNITALDSSLPSKYSVSSTIQELLNQLMIEKWNVSSKYKMYYNACQPMECSYIRETRNGVVYIITTLFGLAGGLTTVLKIIVPIFVKCVSWIIGKYRRRIVPAIST